MAHQYAAVANEVAQKDGASRQFQQPPGILARYVTDGWALEGFSALLGTVLTILLCVLLRNYDGERVPSFGSVLNTNVTLNFVISLILSVAVPAFMFPVGQCMSQLKWIWFARAPRPLDHLETFDGASRGTFGGAQFLWKMRARPFASIGAFLGTFQLLVSPLAQNAVVYPLETIKELDPHHAKVSVSKSWKAPLRDPRPMQGGGYVLLPPDSVSLAMKGAIQNGIFSGDSTISPLPPSCSSGNCTIGPYRTLAVCSSSASVTSSVTETRFESTSTSGPNTTVTRYSLPGGPMVQLGHLWPLMKMTSAADFAEDDADEWKLLPFLNFGNSIAFQNISNPIADILVMYQHIDSSRSRDYWGGVEFMLGWCLQTLESTVENGHTTTRVLDRYHAFRTAWTGDIVATPSHNASDNSKFTSTSYWDQKPGIYTIDHNAHAALQRYFYNLLHGSIYPSGPGLNASSDVAEAFYTPFEPGQLPGPEPKEALDALLSNVATSMTNEVQRSAGVWQFPGTVSHQRTVVRVQWPFLLAPLVFMALCLLFLGATLAYQRVAAAASPQSSAAAAAAPGRTRMHVHAWKSSSLATLHALESDMQRILGPMAPSSILQQQAQRVTVQLNAAAEGDGTWRLASTETTPDQGMEMDALQKKSGGDSSSGSQLEVHQA